MSDIYEECNPFPFTSQQVLPQSSTPKEGLENKGSAEPKHVALQRIISLTDTESVDTYESFHEYSSLEEDKYLLEKKYAYDQVSMTEQMCKWRNYNEEEDDIYENIYEDIDLYTSSHPLSNFDSRKKSLRMSLLNDLMQSSLFHKSKDVPHSKDQSTQTEWVDKSKVSELKAERWALTYRSYLSITSSSNENVALKSPKENEKKEDAENLPTKTLEDHLSEEPKISLDDETIDEDTVLKDYQSKLMIIISEMKERNELEGDTDISMLEHLDPKIRRKLAQILKKNYENCKEAIEWVIRKNEALIRTTQSILEFRLSYIPEKTKTVGRHRKKVELETKLIPETESSQILYGDGKIILYPDDETTFQIIFPDGSGQIHYPSGKLAMLILSLNKQRMTYIILEDDEESTIRGLVNNRGHATFYDEKQEVWVSLSPSLGYYFPRGKFHKAWNWWDLSIHVHAPPVQSISLQVNHYITVHIKNQGQIIFCFTHQKQHICLNLGTKFKPLAPEELKTMKETDILEVEVSSLAQKIQILLGKISQLLNVLSMADLELFTNAQQEVFVSNKWVSMPALIQKHSSHLKVAL